MHHSSLRFNSLRFKKTGKQIAEALAARVLVLKGKQEKLREEVELICKRRELDAAEVYAAGSNEAAISTYSNKMSSNFESIVRATIPKSVIEALQSDIDRLQTLGRKHAQRTDVLTDLERVRKNVAEDPSREHDLAFDELATLGF